MSAAHASAVAGAPSRRIRLGSGLLCVGLVGHLLAAEVVGGSSIAYTHHVAGFVLLTVLSGVVIAGFSLRFWKGRHDTSLLIVGALQAVLGLLIYLLELAQHQPL